MPVFPRFTTRRSINSSSAEAQYSVLLQKQGEGMALLRWEIVPAFLHACTVGASVHSGGLATTRGRWMSVCVGQSRETLHTESIPPWGQHLSTPKRTLINPVAALWCIRPDARDHQICVGFVDQSHGMVPSYK